VGEDEQRVAFGRRPGVDPHAEAELRDGPVVVCAEVDDEPAEVGAACDVVALGPA